ncbi:TRAP transporter small permease subunit [Chloroflexota bacterium]
MLVVVVEVLGRKLLNVSTFIAYDIASFGFAGIIFFGLAQARRSGTHLKVKVFNILLPLSIRKILDLFFSLFTLFYIVFLLRYAVPMVISNYSEKTLTVGAVQLVIWPAQVLMLIGLSVFIIMEFIYFIRQFCVLIGIKLRVSSFSNNNSTQIE